ncbi:MAG TPA: hypothetical protein VGM88_12420 [Kofleriaceae bacterium]
MVASFGLAAAACTGGIDDSGTDDNNTPPINDTSGGSGNTFDHDNNSISVWDLLQRLEQEGPQTFTSHMHHCGKPLYDNLGRILSDFGVTTAGSGVTAGGLYTSGFNAMGGPNYANRLRETVDVTTSGASREFDIFAAAAPDIITNMPTLARCQVNGVGPQMFDDEGHCRADGIACLLGVPATAQHLDLCNLTLTQSPTNGKNIAVAALLAAAYTCE